MSERIVLHKPVDHSPDLFSALYAIPGRRYPVHRVPVSGITGHQAEIFQGLSPRRGQGGALALMIGAALRGQFSIALAQYGIVTTDIDLHLVFAGRIEIASKIKGVP